MALLKFNQKIWRWLETLVYLYFVWFVVFFKKLTKAKLRRTATDRSNEISKIYEKDRKEKEEIVKHLEGKVNNLTETVAELVKQADNQEQYSRRNCLLVHGLFETTLENTDDLVITMFKIIWTSKFFRMTLTDRIELGSKRMTPTQLGQSLLNSRGRYSDRNKIFRNKKTIKRKENVHHRKLSRIKNEHVKRG